MMRDRRRRGSKTRGNQLENALEGLTAPELEQVPTVKRVQRCAQVYREPPRVCGGRHAIRLGGDDQTARGWYARRA